MKKLPEQIEEELRAKLTQLNDIRVHNDSKELAQMVKEGFRSIASRDVTAMQSILEKITLITANETLKVAEEETNAEPDSIEPKVEELRAKLSDLSDIMVQNESKEVRRMVIEGYSSIKAGDLTSIQSSLDNINLFKAKEALKVEVEALKLAEAVNSRSPSIVVSQLNRALQAGEVYMNHLLASGMKQENVLDEINNILTKGKSATAPKTLGDALEESLIHRVIEQRHASSPKESKASPAISRLVGGARRSFSKSRLSSDESKADSTEVSPKGSPALSRISSGSPQSPSTPPVGLRALKGVRAIARSVSKLFPSGKPEASQSDSISPKDSPPAPTIISPIPERATPSVLSTHSPSPDSPTPGTPSSGRAVSGASSAAASPAATRGSRRKKTDVRGVFTAENSPAASPAPSQPTTPTVSREPNENPNRKQVVSIERGVKNPTIPQSVTPTGGELDSGDDEKDQKKGSLK